MDGISEIVEVLERIYVTLQCFVGWTVFWSVFSAISKSDIKQAVIEAIRETR